ncbi:uncharacterized protein KGF55_003723 [Candida pseudojiufengensis]|uniref:uncharacterized protein n=1 Tax=Candida pseudojiufengensis TaxID=497109 RepID=UPI002224CFFC|nr:uncharacterized protein KGF55_003723 [Candida pseudojiufengensis]KAI5962647.1 hypothetical protein KGF55_003723 [Candida pseudojiufengensis]
MVNQRSKRAVFFQRKTEPEPQESILSKHGQPDSNFVDTTIENSFYPWTTLEPKERKLPPIKKLRPLKDLCAFKISLQYAKIDEDLLKSLPWHIWKLVWGYILYNGKDSIDVYCKFNNIFGSNPEFRSHIKTPDKLQTEAIGSNKIARNRFHRLDSIFKNVPMSELVSVLNKSKSKIILDLSHLQSLKREDYFMLFNITNLMCLNLSNHPIDDSFCTHLSSAINNGKLSGLYMLKLCNTNITRAGLLKIATAPNSNIQYIEINSDLNHHDWNCLVDVRDLPLAKKFYHMSNLYHSKQLSHLNIWDLLVVDETYPASLDILWRARFALRSQHSLVYLNNVFLDAYRPKYRAIPEGEESESRKRRKLKTNANDFFSL